jgi:hypothetical protein
VGWVVWGARARFSSIALRLRTDRTVPSALYRRCRLCLRTVSENTATIS